MPQCGIDFQNACVGAMNISMNRTRALQRLQAAPEPFDLAVIGGGATGVGIAVDAALRGYSILLVEQNDLGKGTSSRSTKLIHGGVRYLQQGNIPLVMHALKERGILLRNAAHLVHPLAFVIPCYAWWEQPFYGIGMKVYDLLAMRGGFPRSRWLLKKDVLERIPTVEQSGLRGGVLYYDGQFDDARLLINLAQTADEQGAILLNYARVNALMRDAFGSIDGIVFTDLESGREHSVRARCVINATGAFSDQVRKLDEPTAAPIIAPSQGVHIVIERSFLPGTAAIMIPKTSDGRVLFAIPWHERTLIGTTDTPIDKIDLEPFAMQQEIEFILETAGRYLTRRPRRTDILSVFTGIRPLVKAADKGTTSALSRDHTILVSKSGMLSIAGGKWTTYRQMAEDCVNHAAALKHLPSRPCVTKLLKIHGCQETTASDEKFTGYGSDAAAIRALIDSAPDLGKPLHDSVSICAAEIVWAVRSEMARTVDDVLSRRTRTLLLDAKAAVALAPAVAKIMASELGRDERWQSEQVAEFNMIAEAYTVTPT